MTASAWLPPIITGAGVLLSGGLAYVGAHHGTRQREAADRRAEWGRRFTVALDELASPDERRQDLGRATVEALLGSGLASSDDRDLAKAILTADAILADDERDVRAELAGADVDDTEVIEDTGGNGEGERA